MTTKKSYEKPSMKVVKLKQQPRLLVGSNRGGFRSGPEYTPMDD